MSDCVHRSNTVNNNDTVQFRPLNHCHDVAPEFSSPMDVLPVLIDSWHGMTFMTLNNKHWR